MPYQFTPPGQDYSDYASGRVFYGAPGQATFPARLISEIFLRCQSIRQKQGLTEPVTIYDPCCGSAYHLAVCAWLHWPHIKAISGSDVDADALSFAARNLGLLTAVGLHNRIAEIETLHAVYGKASHADALQSAARLQQQLRQNLAHHAIETRLFAANALQPDDLRRELVGQSVDIIVADVPYGRRANWQGVTTDTADLLWQLLDSLLVVLSPHTLVAIAADKAQTCRHDQYRQQARFQIGKRRVFLLQPGYGKVQAGN
ncbi:MAG: hypothetical protein KJ069_01445 [Anaerolineae bacterium]|nr:hypothetical protein [Anaerolineae bacterium]